MELSWLRTNEAKRSYSLLPTVERADDLETKSYDKCNLEDDTLHTQKAEVPGQLRRSSLMLLLLGTLLFVLALTLRPWSSVPVVTLEDDEPMPGGVATQPLFANVAHPDTPNALWGTTARPYPTGAFWTNLVVGAGDGPVGVYPYGIKTLDVGIQVSYGASRRIVSKKAITDNFVADLQIAAVSPNAAHSVEKHDKLSVTMGYKTTANGKYRVHIVKSSPFVTVVYENAAPMITSSLMHILTVEPQVVKDSTGVQYIVTLGNYQKWLVYCSEPMPLSFTGNALFSLTPIRGFIRVAILPVQNYQVAFTTLMQYVRRYPTGAVVAVQYPSDQVAVVDVEYTTVGDGELLMLSLPHHEAVMVEPDLASEDNVRLQAALTPIWCIKGKLKAVLGAKWRLQYNLTQVGWNYVLSDKLSTSRMDEIGANLMREVSQVAPTAEDPYSFGKQLQRLAALALLADNLGIADARKTAMDTIKAALTPWLLGTNSNAFVYDSTYGGLLNINSLTDKYSDFGAGWYSDHHFHYGYIIYAAAVVAKLDSGAQGYFSDVANKNAMALLVKDICGMDDQDSDFPFARHKDLFDGHSWASGLFQQGNGKGQESSSEAVNAYYAVYLYALATQQADMQRFASALLTMEIASAQAYWHMHDASIYDAVFAQSAMVGNIGALDVTASTWFGDNAEFVHGINLMPITPATAVLFDSPYIQAEYPVLAARLRDTSSEEGLHTVRPTVGPECDANSACKALGIAGLCCPTAEGVLLGCCDSQRPSSSKGIVDEWKGLLYCDLAVVDRDAAWERLMTIGNFGSGNSKANSLYWAATRPAPLPGFNVSNTQSALSTVSTSACSANSACDAIGMLGECCPSATGVRLQCCPAESL